MSRRRARPVGRYFSKTAGARVAARSYSALLRQQVLQAILIALSRQDHQLLRLDAAVYQMEDVESDHVPRRKFGRVGIMCDCDQQVKDLFVVEQLHKLGLWEKIVSDRKRRDLDAAVLTWSCVCSVASAEDDVVERSRIAAKFLNVCKTREMMLSSFVVRSL